MKDVASSNLDIFRARFQQDGEWTQELETTVYKDYLQYAIEDQLNLKWALFKRDPETSAELFSDGLIALIHHAGDLRAFPKASTFHSFATSIRCFVRGAQLDYFLVMLRRG